MATADELQSHVCTCTVCIISHKFGAHLAIFNQNYLNSLQYRYYLHIYNSTQLPAYLYIYIHIYIYALPEWRELVVPKVTSIIIKSHENIILHIKYR